MNRLGLGVGSYIPIAPKDTTTKPLSGYDDNSKPKNGSPSLNPLIIAGAILLAFIIICILIIEIFILHQVHHSDNSNEQSQRPPTSSPRGMSNHYARNAWPFNGRDYNSSRWAHTENAISVATAHSLDLIWTYTTCGDVSGTPTVSWDGFTYFVDWPNANTECSGHVYAVNSLTGALIWKHSMPHYTGISQSFSRNSPAIWEHLIVVGDQMSGYLVGINRYTGIREWLTLIESHPAAIITQSALIIPDGRIFVAVASREEALAAAPGYPCCTFRGSVVMLEANSGSVLRQFYTLPDNLGQQGGYSGGAIWGSTPTVDFDTNIVYFASGNTYTVPESVMQCDLQAQNSNTDNRHCRETVDMSNSILAFSTVDLSLVWSNNLTGVDTWTVVCLFNPGAIGCAVAGPDADFGQGVSLATVHIKSMGGMVKVVAAGQKSGIFHILRASDGHFVSAVNVSPGGTLGGIMWGHAMDDRHYYVAYSNIDYLPYTLLNGTIACSGGWAAIDKQIQKIIWRTPTPDSPTGSQCDGTYQQRSANNTLALGPTSVVNYGKKSVVFGGAMSGKMYAFDSSNGKILFTFNAGASIISGAAIVDGIVYFGSGYSNFGLGTPGNKVYALGLTPDLLL